MCQRFRSKYRWPVSIIPSYWFWKLLQNGVPFLNVFTPVKIRKLNFVCCVFITNCQAGQRHVQAARVRGFLRFTGVLNDSEFFLLSSIGYINSFKGIQDKKIMLVQEYIMNNFKEDIFKISGLQTIIEVSERDFILRSEKSLAAVAYHSNGKKYAAGH